MYKLVPHKQEDLWSTHIHVASTAAYIHFATGHVLDIPDINGHSSYISELKNRPIFVFSFNPHTMSVFLGTSNYTFAAGKEGRWDYHKI
jgi:hypothetical protein